MRRREFMLYGGRPLWKYASENVWKWAPVWECKLEKGQHEISVHSINSRLRIESGSTSCPKASECRTIGMWMKLGELVNDYLDSIT